MIPESGYRFSNENPVIVSAVLEFLQAQDCGRALNVRSWLACYDETIHQALRDVLAGLQLLGPNSPPRRIVPDTLPDFGRYTRLFQIGCGGMAAVYRGFDTILERPIALKIIHADLAGDANAIERFNEEARVASQLQHPNIAPVYDVGVLPGMPPRPHFAMKLIVGRTFAAVMDVFHHSRTDLLRDALLRNFMAVCNAVEYAHEQGVLHRDLKPTNVMVGEHDEIQVMDWGLSKKHHDMARMDVLSQATTATADEHDAAPWCDASSAVRGTPPYMSPEQASGLPLGPQCDVFGLGAILCEIFTGSPPYRGTSVLELVTKACHGDLGDAFERLSKCGEPIELVQLTIRCLAPALEDRVLSAQAIGDAIASFMADRQRKVREAELAKAAAESRVAEERKRRRAQLWLVASLVLFMFSVASLFTWRKWELERATHAQQRLQLEATNRLLPVLTEARSFREQHFWSDARAAAQKAQALSRDDRIESAVRQEVNALVAAIESEIAQGERDRKLLTRVFDVGLDETILVQRLPSVTLLGLRSKLSSAMDSAELQPDPAGPASFKSAGAFDPNFAAAFIEYGINLAEMKDVDIVSRIASRPAEMRREIASVLDLWAFADRDARRPQELWRRLYGLARAVDPDSVRDELRQILAKQQILPQIDVVLAPLSRLVPESDHRRLLDMGRSMKLREVSSHTVRLLALALLTVREREVAENLLRSASQVRPDDAGIYNSLAMSLVFQSPSRWEEAIPVLQAVRALRPSQGGALTGLLARAGRFDEALIVCDDLEQRRPGSGWPYAFRSNVLLRQHKLPEALAACDAALAHDPGIILAYNNRAVAYTSSHQLDMAEVAAREAIRREPDWSLPHGNLGMILLQKGEIAEAERECRKATQLDPANPQLQANLANALIAARKFAAAELVARNAIAFDATSVDGHAALGVALAKSKRYAEAETPCRAAVRLAPNNGLARSNLALVFSELGRQREAEDEAQSAQRATPDDPQVQYQLGEVLERAGKHAEANVAFQNAVKLRPADKGFHHALAASYANLRKSAEALAEHRQAAELPPATGVYYFILAAHLEEHKKYSEAEEAYQTAIKLSPDNLKYPQTLALMLEENGRLADAKRVLKKAPKTTPANLEQYLDAGALQLKLGQCPEAEAAYRQALRSAPKSLRAISGLASSLCGQGKQAEAIAILLEAKGLETTNNLELHNFALELQKSEQWQASADVWNRLIRQLTNDNKPASVELRGWAYSSLGFCLDRLGKWRESADAFEESLAIDPQDSITCSLLAGVQLRSGNAEASLPAFRQLIKLEPKNAQNIGQFALALSLSGHFFEAADTYRQLLTIDTDNEFAYLGLGISLIEIGEFSDAVEILRQAARFGADSSPRLALLGAALRQLGRIPEAEEALIRAEKCVPVAFRAPWQRAMILADRGNFAAAITSAKQAIKLCPETYPGFSAMVQDLQTLKLLDQWAPRIDDIVAGRMDPADAQQSQLFATLAASEGYALLSVRLFERTFKVATNPNGYFAIRPRVLAVQQALRAIVGPIIGKPALTEPEKAALRDQARRWLEEELELLRDVSKHGSAFARSRVHCTLRYLQTYPTFNAVRDASAFAQLPSDERAKWKHVWSAIEDVRIATANAANANSDK